MKRVTILWLVILFLISFRVSSQEVTDKDETRLEDNKKTEQKGEGKQKKVSVFEIVNKLLAIDVKTEGRRLNREQRAEISGKIEGSMKDCIAKVLMEHEEFQKRDKKLFDSDYVIKVKMEGGVFKKIKILKSKTKSPFMKECINALIDFESGYNINTEVNMKLKTRLK